MKKSMIMNGLFLAAIWLVVYAVLYFVNPNLLFNAGLSLVITLLIPIFIMRKGILEEREANEGMITFGEAFVTAMVIFFIGSLVYNGAQALHISVDESFKQAGEQYAYDIAIETMDKVSGFVGMDEETKAEAIAELDKNPPKLTPGQYILGFFIGLIFPGAIIALIMAAVLKKT